LPVRKIVVIASASGNGKTTLGRQLAERLGVPFVELDELVHGPGWVETSDADLRARLVPLLAGDGWVADGAYQHKLGDFVLDHADTVVWLDLPLRIWLPRLTRRTWRRLRGREQLWNGNRESLTMALWGRDSLFVWAIRSHFRRRREWPDALSNRHVVRLTSRGAVEAFLRTTEQPPP
jgi:adenylate kinase family enzyme